jgi:hypothetical protein
MSERSIFLNALDREDAAARAAYLDEACAGRPELRRRIERLLRAHQMGGAFLDVPAPGQLLGGDQALAFLALPASPAPWGGSTITTSLLATCAEDGAVRLWDLNAGPRAVRTIGPGPFGGPVRSVAFTPDGRYLSTANANGMVYLLRVPPPTGPEPR